MVCYGGHCYGRTAAVCLCGVALRLALGLAGLQPTLEGALELVVSSTSWERAQEGIFLGTLGLSHYAGGVFTGSPLMLAAAALCSTLPSGVQAFAASILFAAFDVASALLLRAICVRAVAVESGDWETQLEEWMDEESKPPGLVTPDSPSSSQAASKVAGDVSTAREREKNDMPPANPRGGTTGGNDSWGLPDVVLAAYLLNPVLAGQCAALSGDVLGRVLPLAALAAAGAGRPGLTASALAASVCLWRFYAAPLLLPAALVLGRTVTTAGCDIGGKGAGRMLDAPATSAADDEVERECGEGTRGRGEGNGARRGAAHKDGRGRAKDSSSSTGGADSDNDKQLRAGAKPSTEEVDATGVNSFDPRYFELDTKAFLRLCVAFAAWCAIVLAACWVGTSRSWDFLRAAARGQLLCEDLTPNAGLYWYFFAELFPRFRGFFRVLFLSHPYVYVLPATLRLGMFPEALAVLLLAIFGLFQPYPTLAEPMLAGCLFLCHPRTSARMRLVIPVGLVALIPSLLLPTMRHVWLQAGTGNANFYYFQTVVLNVLLSVFVLQFAAALVKRRKAVAVAFEKRRKAQGGKAGGDAVDAT